MLYIIDKIKNPVDDFLEKKELGNDKIKNSLLFVDSINFKLL